MTAQIIDGKAIGAQVRAEAAAAAAAFRAETGVTPGLAVVIVGEDPASQVYVRNKGLAVEAAGMHGWTHALPADTSQAELLALVARLNADPAVHGVLVQAPLPAPLDIAEVQGLIDPDKDVDGFHPVNVGRLSLGRAALVPPTPLGCLLLLERTLGSLAGMEAVVLGRSPIVGRPMAQLLLAADCTVTVAHSRSRDLPALCRRADILVAAVGRPEMVRGDWIKPGAAVIDVGLSRVPSRDPDKAAARKTRLTGDVDFPAAAEVAGWITPVPGGVGPMTIGCLLRNTVTAARLQFDRERAP